MFKKNLIYFFLILISFNISGCASIKKGKEIPNIDQESLYSLGLKNFDKKLYKKSIENFESIKSIYPYSLTAKNSMEILIKLYRIKKQYDDALLVSEELMILYPNHENMENIRYQHAIIYYEKMNSQLRDQSLITKTARIMMEFLDDFPNSKFKKDINNKLLITNSRLIYKEIEVGYFYEIQRNYTAALKRYLIANHYSYNNNYHSEILYRIYYCYKMIGLEEEGLKYFDELQRDYSETRWAKFSKDFKGTDVFVEKR